MEAKAYRIVHKRNSGELQEEVNKLIQEGWQPLGGVMARAGGGWAQAMVKR